VQGVGYRPFVYCTAHDLGIHGSVLNGSGKVFIHAEGSRECLDMLEDMLINAAPPLARPSLDSSESAPAQGLTNFEILASESSTAPEIHVPPDLFTCDECVKELTSPEERRHDYPFINCTQCGPRYTIITALPYDRPNTSMKEFPLCDACRAEYESPRDRRFHAQPLACPDCGPQLEYVGGRITADPRTMRAPANALSQAIGALERGEILAVKGVGGYHLMCDASNDLAVRLLRERKHRPHKPLAVMFPLRGEDGLNAVREALLLGETVAHAIIDPARPIVLASKRPNKLLSDAIAPGLAELGAFLPYSPLHHLLLGNFGRPVVATSGNISGEPVITDNKTAQKRLGAVADVFLHHNRPILRPADDPVMRPIAGRARAIRLGRGIAPLERQLETKLDVPLIAVGGHMKVTVALAWDDRVVISPHIGDMDSLRSRDVFARVIADLQGLYDVKAKQIVCDLHPGYASSRWAETYSEKYGSDQNLPILQVQHHAAHASSLAGEHPDIDRWLVFTWDGVGYGSDGALWGGEALAGAPGKWQRKASFRPFRLVGGDKAGREPWRSAAALMWAGDRDWSPDFAGAPEGINALAREAWNHGTNVFETSAAGRLFDAAAALVLGRNKASFEGQGPMELEALARESAEAVSLPLTEDKAAVLRSDWAPLLPVLADLSLAPNKRADIFHETMAQALVDQALRISERTKFDAVGLSGGVFQNCRLSELVIGKLDNLGIDVRLHEEVPANDGGLCFGQVIEALALSNRRHLLA
jgi:hydrogenase maturation protein HypF